jgi:hypothetical protein
LFLLPFCYSPLLFGASNASQENHNTKNPRYTTLTTGGRFVDTSDLGNCDKRFYLFWAWLISEGTDSIEFVDQIPAGIQVYFRAEVYGQPDVEGISQLIFNMRTAVSNPNLYGLFIVTINMASD